MKDQLNIIIADTQSQSADQVKAICRTLPGLNIMGTAHSQRMLIAKLNAGNVDLVLLRLSREIDGIEVIDQIKEKNPDLDIIILYEADSANSGALISALERGVDECIELPDKTDERQNKKFRLRLLTLTGLLHSRKRFAKNKPRSYKSRFFARAAVSAQKRTPPAMPPKIEIVVIAASTGGPEILSRIFSILPGHLPVPVLLVQHIPENITAYFAKSLNEKSELAIHLARQGEKILPQKVYMAPGGHHMTVSMPDEKGQRTLILDKNAPVDSVRPSADLLFTSIAESYPGNVLAVVLTGMGGDGKKGVAALKEKGCYCITQSSETCVVYGMPRAVDEAGLSDESLDPLSITQRIVTLVKPSGH